MHRFLEAPTSIHEQQITKLHEAIANAHHVTVEFGTGNLPMFEAQGKTLFNQSNLYIGANLDSRQHKYLAGKIEDVDGYAILSTTDQNGSLERLPIPDQSVDTVFMANVFGEPDSQHIMEQFKGSDRLYKGNSSISAKVQTIKEVGRLLKPGGKIIVLENNTPYKAGFSGNYDEMATLLEGTGLQVMTTANQKDEDWEELASQFAKPAEWWSYSSYLVIAQKPKSQ